MGRILVGTGLVLVLAGLVVMGVERLAGTGGRGLPGDLTFRWGNVAVYLPIATGLLISLVLTAVLWLLGSLGRR